MGEKTFTESFKEFVSDKYGGLLGSSYIETLKTQFNLQDIDNSPREKKEVFVNLYLSNLYGDKLSPEAYERRLSICNYSLFGDTGNLPFQPVTYFHFSFGSGFGNLVLDISQKIDEIDDIGNLDERYQEELVKNVLNDMYIDSEQDALQRVDEQVNTFSTSKSKHGVHAFRALMPEGGYDLESSQKLIGQMQNFVGRYLDGSHADIPEEYLDIFLDKMKIASIEKDFFKDQIHKNVKKKARIINEVASTEDGLSIVNSLKDVLASYIGSKSAEKIIMETLDSLNLTNLAGESVATRESYLGYIMTHSILSKFSQQRIGMIKDKLSDILLRQ